MEKLLCWWRKNKPPTKSRPDCRCFWVQQHLQRRLCLPCCFGAIALLSIMAYSSRGSAPTPPNSGAIAVAPFTASPPERPLTAPPRHENGAFFWNSGIMVAFRNAATTTLPKIPPTAPNMPPNIPPCAKVRKLECAPAAD